MTEHIEVIQLGRPSSYRPEYCLEIIEFFNRDPIETKAVEYEDKNGEPQTKIVTGPCQCPTFEKFSADIGVSRQTLLSWTKKFPDFLVAYERSRSYQANIMMVNAMNGYYNAGFTGLSMKNMHGWKDKSEVENTHMINSMPPVSLGDKKLDFLVGDEIEEEGADDETT